MTGDPTLSVIMSVYAKDDNSYLDTAIKSIWTDQTYKPTEIILIQDGPLGDDILQVIQKWKDELQGKLILAANPHNCGLTKSLNKAIGLASGKYIARMDADDIAFETRFKKQIDFLEANPGVHLTGAGISEIDENGKHICIRAYPEKLEQIKRYIVKASPLAHPTVMFRREVFDQGMRYNEKYRKSQDLEFWFRLLKNGYVLSNIQEPLLYFRRTSDTYIKRKSFSSLRGEFLIYARGIRSLYGTATWRYVFPCGRFCFKLLPAGWVKTLYNNLYVRKIN